MCNGPGEIYECGCADIPEGDCDCDGNVLDECGICGGDGILPETATAMATSLTPSENAEVLVRPMRTPMASATTSTHVWRADACGVCNGPGEIYECGCADIPEGDCDCDGNVLDECGICGGDGIPAGDCDCDGNQLDALGECGGPCEDADAGHRRRHPCVSSTLWRERTDLRVQVRDILKETAVEILDEWASVGDGTSETATAWRVPSENGGPWPMPRHLQTLTHVELRCGSAGRRSTSGCADILKKRL